MILLPEMYGRKSKRRRKQETIANARERDRVGKDSGGAGLTVAKRDQFTGGALRTKRIEVNTESPKLSKGRKRDQRQLK